MLDYAQPGYPQGHFGFGQQITSQDLNTGNSLQGSAFACSWSAGATAGTTTSIPRSSTARNILGLFVQDDWKVTRKLTLNLGLRYEFDVPRYERYNRFSYWDLNAPAPICVPGLHAERRVQVRGRQERSPFDRDTNNFAPRLGFAYALNERTSIRAGAGIFYTLSRATVAGHTGSPFNTNSGPHWSLDSNATHYATLDQSLPGRPDAPDGQLARRQDLPGQGRAHHRSFHRQNPEMYNWNFSIQREVGWDSLVEVNYTGSRGAHLPMPVHAA